ncbi:hypothetical protein ACJX0J_023809, partial [Zea mays]
MEGSSQDLGEVATRTGRIDVTPQSISFMNSEFSKHILCVFGHYETFGKEIDYFDATTIFSLREKEKENEKRFQNSNSNPNELILVLLASFIAVLQSLKFENNKLKLYMSYFTSRIFVGDLLSGNAYIGNFANPSELLEGFFR